MTHSVVRGALAAACFALAGAAQADVTLTDNFNAENGGAGAAEYSGFALWTAANVDLLAPGYFFSLCQAAGGSTPCVDMEGSGNGTLTTLTTFSVFAGDTVTMQFDLAGDQRNRSGNIVTATLVTTTGTTLFSETFMLASDAPFQSFSRAVNIGADAQVRFGFQSVGPADSMGMLLDNVSFTAGMAAPVPEPSTYLLLAAGLGALGLFGRRRSTPLSS
jgi:fluoride ion exporter CrcB/FEX